MDHAAFYNEYINKVYKFFYIKCLDRDIAEDLTSQTFLMFVEQEKNHRQINDHKKYLYGIMRNVWLQFLRNKYDEAISGLENIEDFEDYSNKETKQYESDSKIGRIVKFIDKLPDKQALVIRMRLVEEKSVKEVAKELGKDKNYVKTTHHRGIIKLREMLSQPFVHDLKSSDERSRI